MIINADLHVHSKYSMASSKYMQPYTINTEAQKKGLDLIATGDALHSGWLRELEDNLEEMDDTGIYTLKDETTSTKFVTTTEVEDNQRIHHLLIIPSIEVAWQMRDEFTVKNMDADGRPKIRMNAKEIMDIARRYNCIIGPAHIFTPWTGIFKSYDNIEECYGTRPDFVELGLSSDTPLADTISQLHSYTYLTNSDSHSPWSYRIAREFNRIKMEDLSYKSLQNAIKNNNIIQNYGYNPRMGKYYETGCIQCYKIYPIEEAMERSMKCDCGGQIKKGVKTRIDELRDTTKSPINRPNYQYLVPLAELLSSIYDKGINTKFVQNKYDELLNIHGNEIKILLETPISDLEKTDSKLAEIIGIYRTNNLKITPGRAGQYGKLIY